MTLSVGSRLVVVALVFRHVCCQSVNTTETTSTTTIRTTTTSSAPSTSPPAAAPTALSTAALSTQSSTVTTTTPKTIANQSQTSNTTKVMPSQSSAATTAPAAITSSGSVTGVRSTSTTVKSGITTTSEITLTTFSSKSSSSTTSATTTSDASVVTTGGAPKRTKVDETLLIALVVGIGGVLLIVLVIVIIVIIWKIRKNEKRGWNTKNGNRPEDGDVVIPMPSLNDIKPFTPVRANPIRIPDFLHYVASHQDSMAKYKDEFKSLPEPNVKSQQAAIASEHKNRYINVLPFDETRVDLADEYENAPRYINASYIDGYKKEKAYIATQGPTDKTLEDFWLMVWLQRASQIVMVTRLLEGFRPKCCQYWPKDAHKPQKFGDITVRMTMETVAHDFTVRDFVIQKSKEPERTVRQFHYTTWPDQGVPETCTALIKFHNTIFKSAETFSDESEGPVIIHCSAGVGRSGTLIAVNKLLHEAAETKAIDILKCIEGLRLQRMHMVQTLAQYVFLHHILLEALLLGDVTIPASANFADEYQRLRQPKRPSKKSIIDQQYEVLEVLKPKLDEGMCTVAKTGSNASRNRSSASLPMDHSLYYLRPVDEDDNTYINAVSVNGYQMEAPMYIATQMPLKSTASDFWRLVKDSSCIAIVMLNTLTSSNSSEQYWPVEGSSVVAGKFTVTNIGPEMCSDNIVVTNLSVSYEGHLKSGYNNSSRSHRTSSSSTDSDDDDDIEINGNQQAVAVEERPTDDLVDNGQLYANVPQAPSRPTSSFTVRHIRVLEWPAGRSFPHDKKTLLTLYSLLVECKQNPSKDRFLIHCLHGVQRTGLFCAIMNMMDQLVNDNEVDVYDAVKRVRQARPEFVDNIEQYRYIYELAACHLSSTKQLNDGADDGPVYANSQL